MHQHEQLNRPIWTRLVFALLLSVALTGCALSERPGQRAPRAAGGTLDLEGWDVQTRGPIRLDGEWEFYWRRLLTPEDFARGAAPLDGGRLGVPGVWTGHSLDGSLLPGEGYATYRLVIRNPGADGVRAIYLPVIRTAYRLWIDGELAASAGEIGTARAGSIPRYRTETAYFVPRGDTVELVVQVSNFHHRSGGIHNPIVFGTGRQITSRHEQRVALSLFVFGSLMSMGLYQLNFFAARPRDWSTLYFGTYCVVVAVWTILVREAFLTRLLPGFPWELELKMEYLAIYAGLPLFTLFLRSVYPREVSVAVTRIVAAVGSVFSLFVVFTPARIYTHTLTLYHLFIVVVSLYLLYALVLAIARGRPNAWLTCLAGVVFAGAVYNDILYTSGTIVTTEAAPLGLLFFVLAQALNLSNSYGRAFTAAEQLSSELQELNRTLEAKVAERTLSLERSQRRTAETLAAMSVMQERERIARDIHNSLGHALTTSTVVIEAARRLLIRNGEGAGEKLEQSLELIRKGLSEVRQAVHALRDAPWEMDLSRSLPELIADTTRHTGIVVESRIEPPPRVTPAQREVLYQALQEGLTNGMRHGGSTHFCLSLHADGGVIRFTLTDNGRGAEALVPGFGLRSLREQVQALDGLMEVSAVPGSGCTLTVTLPIHTDE